MIVKGQKIDGRYQIIRTIGEGGMANVYLAYDTILDREVAVKVLRGDLAGDEKFVKRFQREAKAASSLNHPNIVEMYDVGEDNGDYFIVMEYIDGKTLKSLIKKRGALSLTETVDIMLQLTSAIACAHDSYLIHRDIKPQNVLILEDGRVKITDFGIAIAMNSAELTQTNSVMGSVHYLPPEQANGSGATIKSDIYSLGILMYECLTGKLPFKGDNAVEIAIKQMKEKIPSICAQNAIIPQSIENIVYRACAKNPKNRYDSVSEMHEDLKTALSEERKNEKRLVYKYAENDLEETKVLETIKNFNNETRENRNSDLDLEDDDTMPNKKKKKSNGLNIVVILAVTICVMVFFGALGGIYFALSHNEADDIKLPDIYNMEKDEAIELLENEYDLNVKVVDVGNDNVEEGHVIGYEDKKKGNKVKKGANITIIVSSGMTGIAIRDFYGEDYQLVESELKELGLTVIPVEKKMIISKEDIEEDPEKGKIYTYMIIEQSSEPGSRLQEGRAIKLTYAVIVLGYPDFTDGTWTEDSVREFCADNSVPCDFKYEERDDKASGTILKQSRPAGSEVKPGVSNQITVARPVSVPQEPEEDQDNGE